MSSKTESPYANRPTKELGVVGLSQWGIDVYEEFLPQLVWPQAAKIYQEMADNDATIGAILYMSEHLIRRCSWTVEAASTSMEDKEAAAFLTECMHDMEYSWNDTIAEILSMFTYGWSFHEIVYKLRKGSDTRSPKYKSKFSDGRVGWRKLPVRSQHTLYGWVFDDDGNPIAMEQQAPPDYLTRIIPFSRGLLFRTRSRRNNPEGRSLLRNAYRSWYFKKRIEEIEGIGIERDLAGLPVIIPPEGFEIWDPNNPEAQRARTIAEDTVKKVRRDQSEGLVLPFGWEFKLLSTGGTRQFDTNAIINRYDQRIAITMLADIVMLGADKVGSFALADVKKSLLAASLEAQIGIIADVFNAKAVPDLFKHNSFENLTDYPTIVPGEIETPNLKDLAIFLKASGFDIYQDYTTYSFIRTAAGMPGITEEEFQKVINKKEIQSEGSQSSDPNGGQGLATSLNGVSL